MPAGFEIGRPRIGPGAPPFVIAEIGPTDGGSLAVVATPFAFCAVDLVERLNDIIGVRLVREGDVGAPLLVRARPTIEAGGQRLTLRPAGVSPRVPRRFRTFAEAV